ncbi:MAG TPA: 3-hydroxyacyl-CoA dehydrogenase NAD-binding domain-containing protein [Candidatus Sulfotelmatobacter sp.]|nr:3-hydroxyacyl-CoA dehydrogenase NAD-binding domain-containing protein [Candidatus Sulfotelmatobacter sp.]
MTGASAGAAAPARLVIGVVGAGTMGSGIAQVCLQAGHAVRLHDVSPALVAAGRTRVADGLERLVARGTLEPTERDAALRRLSEAPDLTALAGTDLVIEAALEDLELKRSIFRALEAAVAPAALLATNTSALSIDAIGRDAAHPERILGLHFFNPAPRMALVEVVAGERTAGPVMQRALHLVAGLGKTPVECADAPGFIVNRVNRPFTIEALRMVEAGEADVPAVDRALVEAGYPMGPFTLMDLVGLDVNLAAATAIWHGFEEPERFRPSPLQAALVQAGQLGRKTGRGFYAYGSDGRAEGVAPWPPTVARPDPRREPLAADAIAARLELAIINEAYRAAGDGVADPPDIDVALRLGAGHPHGPFERARAIGLGQVVRRLAELERTYGERYRVAPALWQIASV